MSVRKHEETKTRDTRRVRAFVVEENLFQVALEVYFLKNERDPLAAPRYDQREGRGSVGVSRHGVCRYFHRSGGRGERLATAETGLVVVPSHAIGLPLSYGGLSAVPTPIDAFHACQFRLM